MKKNAPQTLWRWILIRILTLSIATVFIVAGCMFLRYELPNLWIIHNMPLDLRTEFLTLQENPELNLARFHQITDEYWSIRYSDPGIVTGDWLMVGLLLLLVTPFLAYFGLRYARPLALQFSELRETADSVSRGQFGVVARLVDDAPVELQHFAQHFNNMSKQIALYEKELRASHVALAHELRSPLTAAIGRLQGMLDGVFEPNSRQMGMIMKQLKHMSRLIDDLHLLSLADAGQLKLDLRLISLRDLAQERVDWAKPQAAEAGMTMCVQAKDACLCGVDPLGVGQVFTILIENALRYGTTGGHLQITLAAVMGGCTLTFRDNGPGVSPEFLPGMFERFSREETSRARHSGGSGLGLSIARAICETHGGYIRAELPAKGGLAIEVFLPEDSTTHNLFAS